MKKSLGYLIGVLAFSVFTLGTVNAELDISTLFSEGAPLVDDAYVKLLNDYDSSWGYINKTVSCDVNNGVVITSPTVEDSTIDTATTYDLFVSPYRMNQLKNGDSSVDISRVIMKKVEIGSDENVRFDISSNELDSNTIYYGFISPVDGFDEVGTPTKEICFNISDNKCLQDIDCDTINVVPEPEPEQEIEPEPEVTEEIIEKHGTADDCVGMDMANVTHTQNGDTITIRRTAVDGDTVDIAIWDPEEEFYKNLGSVRMSAERFDYKIQWYGQQDLTITNGCKGVNPKFDAKKGKSEPEIKVTPATGPAENILYVAIAAIILYGAYTLFFRKSED